MGSRRQVEDLLRESLGHVFEQVLLAEQADELPVSSTSGTLRKWPCSMARIASTSVASA